MVWQKRTRSPTSASPKADSMAAKLTAALLQRYHDVKSRKAALDKESRGLDDEIKSTADEITAALTAMGSTTARRGKLRASLVEKPKSPSWKEAFTKLAGHEAATQLKAAAGTKTALDVSPA